MAQLRFPNLDGLRFIGAALVVVWHTEKARSSLGFGRSAHVEHWAQLGLLGVQLFFVLSGFLITWLLLAEEERMGRINVRKFLMRRVLRIWPLYFLMVLLALFVIPHFGLLRTPGASPDDVLLGWPYKLLLFMLFLPTLVPGLTNGVPDSAHLWSIGTEEYFYALWPFLLVAFKRMRLVLVLGVFLGWPLMNIALDHWALNGAKVTMAAAAFWRNFNIDAMAVGAAMAWLLHCRSRALRVLMDGRFAMVMALATVLILSRSTWISAVGTRTIMVLFGVLVLNLAASPKASHLLEQPVLRYLGRISYGIYVYHPPLIVLVLTLLERAGMLRNSWAYPSIFLLTIAVAGLSHRFFERPFLKLRGKYRPTPMAVQPN